MKRIISTGLCFLFVGCSVSSVMNNAAESWIDTHISQATQQLGHNFQIAVTDIGTIYTWQHNVNMRTPLHTTSTVYGSPESGYSINSATTGGQILNGSCQISLITNEKNHVIKTYWQGNDCCVMTVAGWCGSLVNKK